MAMLSEEDFRQWPYVRLLIPFVAGIILRLNFPIHALWILIFVALSVVLLLLVYFWNIKFSRIQYRWLFGLVLNFFLLVCGCLLTSIHQNRSNFTVYDSGDNQIVARVMEQPTEKPKTYKTILDISGIKGNDLWIRTRGMAIVYIQKDSISEKLAVGDQLIVRGRFQEVAYRNNPYEFNYRAYLFRHGIYCQMYIQSGKWKRLNIEHGTSLKVFAARIQNKLATIYERYEFGNEELAIAGALTLGLRDRLDPELKELYVNAGVMHVLAISGLHVGILYFLVFYLLGIMKKIRYGVLLRALAVIFFLWFFAFLTGLSPSVMRAATMFSFITIGQSLKRPGNIYNTIAASAFFLLMLNPFLIREPGFQLSYTAVTGIIFFQPKFYRLLRSRYWLVDKLWGLITVSLAAQLATFPITVYYFHQFPNYFIISNIITIPLVSIILYTGIIVFLFSFWQAAAGIFAWLMNQSIKVLNYLLGVIADLPFAITEGISNTLIDTVFIYLVIGGFSFFFLKRNSKGLVFTMTVIVLFLSLKTYTHIRTRNQKMIVIYNIQDLTLLGFIEGHRIRFMGTADDKERDRLMYSVSNHLIRLKIDELIFIGSEDRNNTVTAAAENQSGLVTRGPFVYFYGERILLVKDEWPPGHSGITPFDLDLIVVGEDPEEIYPEFFDNYRVMDLVFGSAVSDRSENIIGHKFEEQGTAVHSVRVDGAWIKKIQNR